MKKIATLTIACLLATSITKAQTFSDNFESYTSGIALGPQSTAWATWSGPGGGADDVNVSTTDNHTVAGSKSLYFSSTSSTGGPSDVVLPFNTTPLTTGLFNYTSWYKLPAGKTAYFNFQGNATMGNLFVLECTMAGGTISIKNGSAVVFSCPQPVAAWFELSIDANLTLGSWEMFVNGVSQGTWANAVNSMYAIDIYPADASASYWVDDVSFNIAPYVLPAVDLAGNALNVIGSFNGLGAVMTSGIVGASKSFSLAVKNYGSNTITSFDATLTQNGTALQTLNVTGLTLASLASTTVNFTTPYTYLAGSNTFTATVSNVNGAGPDAVLTNDVKTKVVSPITPAAGKMVVVEEATGTWCPWCVRGTVFMDLTNTYYDPYFIGIAVHDATSDPMTLTAYDAAISTAVGGAYPNAYVDRNTVVDPGSMESDILTRLVIAPKAFLVNGATYNSSTRLLKVSLTTTIQTAIAGNYKVACVLTEDAVTGTSSGYAQSNAYAGGGQGPMGGFESLGSPVSASLMQYNHVARIISPDFAGQSSAYGASAAVAAVFTHTFTYTLPATWDDTQIHIVGMFIDPTGKIDNASSATIAEAVATGYVAGTEIGTVGIAEAFAPDAQVSVYPNPANTNATINLNLEKESTVSIAIYTINGSLIAQKEYGTLNGALNIPVDLVNYKAGMYFINVTIDGKTSVQKLIKE